MCKSVLTFFTQRMPQIMPPPPHETQKNNCTPETQHIRRLSEKKGLKIAIHTVKALSVTPSEGFLQ